MKKSQTAYVPWITDPDPPLKPMTPEQSKRAAEGTKSLVPLPPEKPETAPAKKPPAK